MSKEFKPLMILLLVTGLLGSLMTGGTVSADPEEGNSIQIPRIDMGNVFGTGTWSTRLQIQNVGNGPTWGAVVYWSYPGECPPNENGPLWRWHKRWLPQNGVWTVIPPAGAQSAIVFSLDREPYWQPDERTMADGEPLAVTVDRWGPDAEAGTYQLSSSYVGISDAMHGPGPYRYFAPYVMHRYNGTLDTVIAVQNSGDKCTSVWIYYKQEGNCEYQVAQHILELAPGEAIRVGPPGAVGKGADVAFPIPPGWLGSAYISTNVPLGIIIDQLSYPPSTNQATLLTYRGMPYKRDWDGEDFVEWDVKWYADLLYREISGWTSSIQVQNLTQVSQPTFVTVNFMDQSGKEILFVGDWVCRNSATTFYLPAIVDLGVKFPFGYVGAAEIESHAQVGYPGGVCDGQPIFAVVDIKKTKMWDPDLGIWRPTVAGETQGGAYNAHPESEKVNATGWAMPFIAKEQEGGVTTRIAIRNNSNCNKIKGEIRIKDETGTIVGTIPVPWLHPKHMKVFDLAYSDQIVRGFLGAAEFLVDVPATEQLCDINNDGHVDNAPIMPSVVVLNYGWEYELEREAHSEPLTTEGDLTRIYEGIPFVVGDKHCFANLWGEVIDDDAKKPLSATVTVPNGWYIVATDTYTDAIGTTGPGGTYEIEDIITFGTLDPEPGTCYTVTASADGCLTSIVPNVCLHCGEDKMLNFSLICSATTSPAH